MCRWCTFECANCWTCKLEWIKKEAEFQLKQLSNFPCGTLVSTEQCNKVVSMFDSIMRDLEYVGGEINRMEWIVVPIGSALGFGKKDEADS